jgi:hypothetical protein
MCREMQQPTEAAVEAGQGLGIARQAGRGASKQGENQGCDAGRGVLAVSPQSLSSVVASTSMMSTEDMAAGCLPPKRLLRLALSPPLPPKMPSKGVL